MSQQGGTGAGATRVRVPSAPYRGRSKLLSTKRLVSHRSKHSQMLGDAFGSAGLTAPGILPSPEARVSFQRQRDPAFRPTTLKDVGSGDLLTRDRSRYRGPRFLPLLLRWRQDHPSHLEL